MNQGPFLCCKFAKNNYLQYQVDLVNDDEHTKFGLILSISSQEKTNSDINQGS